MPPTTVRMPGSIDFTRPINFTTSCEYTAWFSPAATTSGRRLRRRASSDFHPIFIGRQSRITTSWPAARATAASAGGACGTMKLS